MTRGGTQYPSQAIKERALTCSIRANNRAHLAAFDREINLIERAQAAEADREIFGPQQRRRRPGQKFRRDVF